MRLVSLSVLVAALVAVPSPLSAAAARPGAPSVALQQCTTGPAADDRVAVFVGRMRSIPGAERLQLRFVLHARGARGRWRAVGGERLGAWNTSDAGVGGYVFTKRVERLAGPGTYRVLVYYRWLDADGDVLRSDRRISASCRQADFRPDLSPLGVQVTRTGEGAHYRVTVGNLGRGASVPFELGGVAGEHALPTAFGPELGPGETASLELDGPPCPFGATATVVVDPAAAVAERRESDNALRVPCPPEGAPAQR